MATPFWAFETLAAPNIISRPSAVLGSARPTWRRRKETRGDPKKGRGSNPPQILSFLQEDGGKKGQFGQKARSKRALGCAAHVPAAAGRRRSCKVQVRAEFSPYLCEEEQIIPTWAEGERGGAGNGCQRPVQIPPGSPRTARHPARQTSKPTRRPRARPVQPLGRRPRGFFCLPPPFPELDLQGRCLSKARQSRLGPRREGKRRISPKKNKPPFRLRFYMIGTAEQHPSSGLTFHLQINSSFPRAQLQLLAYLSIKAFSSYCAGSRGEGSMPDGSPRRVTALRAPGDTGWDSSPAKTTNLGKSRPRTNPLGGTRFANGRTESSPP